MPMQHPQSECYICWGPCELRNICACRGTQGCVHVKCLVQYTASMWSEEARDHRVWTTCQICKTPFQKSVRLPLAKAFWAQADHFWAIYALLIMGEALEANDRLREALPWMEQALELRRAFWGMHESHTLRAASALARVQLGLGDLVKSINLQRDVLRWRWEHLGQADPGTVGSVGRLANSLCLVGGLAEKKEAVELHMQARQLMNRVVVEMNRLDVALVLAKGFIPLGFYREAEAELRELYPQLQRLLGNGHPKAVGALTMARRSIGLLFIYGGTNSMECLADLSDRLNVSKSSPTAQTSEPEDSSVRRVCSQPWEAMRDFLVGAYRLTLSPFFALVQ